MKWLIGMLILAVILVSICLGGYFVYNTAYAKGEAAGYDSGYKAGYPLGQKAGHEEGYNSGKTDGYNEGYTSGRAEGYEEGYSSGKTDGHDEGYTSGRAEGYEEGVLAGLGHGYTLRDPTYDEAVTFLREDKTDRNEYIEDTYGVYICSHFARDVCNNAEKEEFRCAFVELRYLDTGHAIIAFDTVDKGLIYFEAMSDERVIPVIGERYYQCIEPKPGYYYEEPSFDDTIMDILVIW